MADIYINSIKTQRRKIYEQEFEVYQEWRKDRNEALEDGWAFYCRHGFHDNAEGLCGPCEMGADGYFWDWREEIKSADFRARQIVSATKRRMALYGSALSEGGMSEELKTALADWSLDLLKD